MIMNVDHSTYNVVHLETCRYARQKEGTLLKSIGEPLKQDGGWIAVDSMEEARERSKGRRVKAGGCCLSN